MSGNAQVISAAFSNATPDRKSVYQREIRTVAPIVSVVMPVYNSARYLAASVGSILSQTFTDWELICVDDGSTDGSLDILRCHEHGDPRVQVITRPNTGVTRSRNDGMAVARGRYIAAMDSDDVALPQRLRKQVDYMDSHADCVGLGAGVRIVGPDLKPICDDWKVLDHETIESRTLAGAGAAIHQTVAMFRTQAIRNIGGYNEEYFTGEEVDLYLRLGEIGRLANLPEILQLYRLRPGSINRTQYELQRAYISKIIRAARDRRGLPVSLAVPDLKRASIQHDNGRGIWALWSHWAFNGGYRDTALCYGLRAIRSEPFAISSWKAVMRPLVRTVPPRSAFSAVTGDGVKP